MVGGNPTLMASTLDAIDGRNDFDYSYELFKAFTTANQGQGLSEKDVQGILDVFREAKKKGSELEYETIDEYRKYRDRLRVCNEDGWRVQTIRVTNADVPGLNADVSAPFFHRDLLVWLRKMLQKFIDKDDFVLRAAVKTNMDGARIYNEPQYCDAWLHLQSLLPAHSIIAALQLYSDKSLVNMKNLSAHPIRATLLNLSYSDRIKNLDGVGYIPEISRPVQVKNDALWRKVKLQFMSKALELLLSPMKVSIIPSVVIMRT